MSRMIKSISLPPHLHEKAGSIENFSGWVQLRLEEEGLVVHENMHSPIIELGICNGLRKPTCAECYPEGAPTREIWNRFRDHRDIEKMQSDIVSFHTGFKKVENDPQSRGEKPQKKYIRRLLSAIWEYI